MGLEGCYTGSRGPGKRPGGVCYSPRDARGVRGGGCRGPEGSRTWARAWARMVDSPGWSTTSILYTASPQSSRDGVRSTRGNSCATSPLSPAHSARVGLDQENPVGPLVRSGSPPPHWDPPPHLATGPLPSHLPTGLTHRAYITKKR